MRKCALSILCRPERLRNLGLLIYERYGIEKQRCTLLGASLEAAEDGLLASCRVGLGALGSIWAARCLGPEKIGVSGMVQAFSQQALLLVAMGLPTLLIRDYKRSADTSTQDEIISLFTSYRVLVAAVISVSWVTIAVVTKLDSTWCWPRRRAS